VWEIRGLLPGRALFHAYRYEWVRRLEGEVSGDPAGATLQLALTSGNDGLRDPITKYDIEVTATAPRSPVVDGQTVPANPSASSTAASAETEAPPVGGEGADATQEADLSPTAAPTAMSVPDDGATTVSVKITLRDERVTDGPALSGSWGAPGDENEFQYVGPYEASDGTYTFELDMPIGETYLLSLEVV